jgi:hypothetical protein
LDQARRLLASGDEALIGGRETIVVVLSDGVLLYSFDAQGRRAFRRRSPTMYVTMLIATSLPV